ncbi:helix-turn-helix domain-containing protein [Rhizobium sp. SL86]|uniref:helix-turn-helix domain-containing protein n=1 Tax=Rhizobium sp. SL86 TaxID=2995148 RepID=UPI0022766862|nr:helix-turn-helix transcriptional regulator [Rhizobium sp. SL86]MCY1667369.1 helix-turn-helix transcriptional regulator [Rhizobium sp. SL86]
MDLQKEQGEVRVENQEGLNEQDELTPPQSAIYYAERNNLVPTDEDGYRGKIYRAQGFEGPLSLDELKARTAIFLRETRERQNLSQLEVASLLGITAQVWGRYERAVSSLEVTRMIVLCEQLGCNPVELVGHVAPHLFGSSKEGADVRIELARRLSELPDEVCISLLDMVKQIEKLNKQVPRR